MKQGCAGCQTICLAVWHEIPNLGRKNTQEMPAVAKSRLGTSPANKKEKERMEESHLAVSWPRRGSDEYNLLLGAGEGICNRAFS